MGKKQFKFQFIITASVLAAALFLLVVLFIVPLAGNTLRLKQNIYNSRDLVSGMKQKIEHFEELEKLDQQVSAGFPAVEAAILTEKNLPDLLFQLENLGKETKNILVIEQLPQARAVESGDVGAASFQLSLWGSFPDAFRFLTQLEAVKNWLDVSDIKFAKLDSLTLPTGPKYQGITIDDVLTIIRINVFFARETKTATAP